MIDVDGLVQARESLSSIADRPTYAWSDAELIELVDHTHAVALSAHALHTKVLREIETRDLARKQGATSTAVWLRERHRLSNREATKQVRLAKALDSLPLLAAGIADGTINPEQAHVIAKAVTDLPTDIAPQIRAQAESRLVDLAAHHGPEQLRVLGTRVFGLVAPELAEQADRQAWERAEKRAWQTRALTLSPDSLGRVRLHGWLPSEAAAVIVAALDPLSRPRGTEDDRTAAARRADALIEVVQLALATGDLPENGGDKAQIVITTHYDVLRRELGGATLDTGEKLTPAAVRRLCCDAAIIPAVLDSAGQLLDLGRERRLFTGPLRRALILRDRGCTFPGCDRPPKWTHGHHLIHWEDGGPTSLDNGCLLCGFHHRLIHHSEWTVRLAADGHPEFIPPAWLDPTQTPRRNHYHRQP